MIKVELLKKGLEINIKGMGPIVYAEAGIMLNRLYHNIAENVGKEAAKRMIRDLAEHAVMSDEERHNMAKKFEGTYAKKMATEFVKEAFGVKEDEAD